MPRSSYPHFLQISADASFFKCLFLPIDPHSFRRNLNLIVAYDVIRPMVDLFIILNNSAENIVKAHSGENS